MPWEAGGIAAAAKLVSGDSKASPRGQSALSANVLNFKC